MMANSRFTPFGRLMSSRSQQRVSTQLPGLGSIIRYTSVGVMGLLALLTIADPAVAHHAMGGKLATTWWEGFLSGLAHPIVGLDHLAFVVAIGLLSAQYLQGAIIPAAFLITSMVGTELHVMRVSLPETELLVASSVILLGVLLSVGKRWTIQVLALFVAIAGLAHGYAYGESIVGAETTPLIAYLLGFTLIQFLIAMLAQRTAHLVSQTDAHKASLFIRCAGYAVCAIGVVFLAAAFTA